MDADFALEQLNEQAGVADIITKRVVDQMSVFTQQANGVSAHTFDFWVLGHQHKDFQHGERCALEHVRPYCLDVAVMQAEACIQRLGAAAVVVEDHLFKMLDDQVAELSNAHDHPVVLLHELLDGAFGVVIAEAKQGSNAALVIEQQTVFGATGEHVQGVADLPQELLGGGQQGVFALQQEAFASQGVQVQGAVLAPGDPQHGLNVAQAAG
ncbi:hypothetical protein D3C78_928730 [compost metagenome]